MCKLQSSIFKITLHTLLKLIIYAILNFILFLRGYKVKKLPNEFINIMESMFKEEFSNFIKFYEDEKIFKGIRINTLKCNSNELLKKLNINVAESKFCEEGFYINSDIKGLGKHPLHHAGAFYIQEPSASSAVTILDPHEGEKILDLCASPGGKSTQIASKLNGKGLLWSNEIVSNRAKVLLSNIERMGVRNASVSSCHPDVLCNKLCGFFDRVLVDAPCSGEGMFRKEPEAINNWSMDNVKMCAIRQLALLNTASKAVKYGGVIVYSTCTFSPEENEGVISKFLQQNPDFELENINVDFGRNAYEKYGCIDLNKALRIFPMDGGEGHFVAKLRCKRDNNCIVNSYDYKGINKSCKLPNELFEEIFNIELYGEIEKFGDSFMILPQLLPNISGLGVIRAGVQLGVQKKSRIEPSHALFMASKPIELNSCINFNCDSNQIMSFLKGEELIVDEGLSGYVGVSVDNIVVGFGKCSNGRLKNKYPKGLRNSI